MTFPQWLDPTPITRQFVDGFADCPVREPFLSNRSQMLRVKLTWKQRMQEAKARKCEIARQNALKGGAKTRAKAVEAAMARGETMEERRRRQKNESQIRRRERERAARPPYSAKGNSSRFPALA